MKRTGEIILSIIGMCLYALISLLGFALIALNGNEDFTNEMENIAAEDPALSGMDMGAIGDAVSAGGWYFIIVSLLSIVIGIVCLVLLKGNKHPKAAGIILIVVAVLSTLGTFFLAIISGILYLIAGILCLVRKPKETFNNDY
ncbi:DUF4064 domain-containing protein [Fredinandcohnia quinoae]|uniref:DUF4064 domain-containing protein n=1 Tax=Fredinandcohnia quinoae TaxID=2918902 RepID=A0AAW5EA55_9BACI|nr:DUF4064 domain-containing protein [Fredinandcohnia sp. SECRCQ15]MCH1625614.1 DUF4064 domain-containing protein [Fredinandcohnia sp. SECRCQ15]